MLDLPKILSTRIPDLAAVYGGVRGRTLSSHHQDNAWNVMKAAGLKQVIDLRQDYKGDRYPETCEAYGIKYFHYPVNKGRDYIANMVKDFDVFCGLIDSGDFFISCAQGLHRTDIALSTYWVFHGADIGKEPPILVGYLKEKGLTSGKIIHVLDVFYELSSAPKMPIEVFKERKEVIKKICKGE
jgi:hypothetical protein